MYQVSGFLLDCAKQVSKANPFSAPRTCRPFSLKKQEQSTEHPWPTGAMGAASDALRV